MTLSNSSLHWVHCVTLALCLWAPFPFDLFPLTFPLFFNPNFCGFLFSMTDLT